MSGHDFHDNLPSTEEVNAMLAAEGVEAVLAEHVRILDTSKNLGQYRTEWECTCGYLFVSDDHRGLTAPDLHRAHVAAQVTSRLADYTRRIQAEALRKLADDIDPDGYGWASRGHAIRFQERIRARADRIENEGAQ